MDWHARGRGAGAIDQHVGLRMRMRRKELGWSQEQLADAARVTFQQIQKYERAANRVSASKLWEIAQALEVPVAYFFDGLREAATQDAPSGRHLHEFLLSSEGHELSSAFPRISDAALRRKLLELVRGLGEA